VRKVDPRDPLLLPPLAEGGLIVKKAQLFYYVIHDEVGVNRGWLTLEVLFEGLAQLAHLGDVESSLGVQSQHSANHLPQLRRVLVGGDWRELALRDSLEEIIKR
jgi:hypothetical protein